MEIDECVLLQKRLNKNNKYKIETTDVKLAI